MLQSKKQVGDRGEDLAAQFLQSRGYTIVARHWRQRFGEVDIIAQRDGILAFCEVKRSRYAADSHPEIRVNRVKQLKLARLARAYLAQNQPDIQAARFDVIAIKEIQGREIIEHIENAFWPPDDWN